MDIEKYNYKAMRSLLTFLVMYSFNKPSPWMLTEITTTVYRISYTMRWILSQSLQLHKFTATILYCEFVEYAVL